MFVLFPIRLADLEKQLEQLLQQVTTLRGDIASSRPVLTKGCCKGNNYEQRFARTIGRNVQGEAFHFMAPFLAMAKLERARFCAWLIESVVTSCKSCIGCFSYSTGVPTCSFVNKKSSAISKKVSISRGNLPKKGTFPRLIDMFFSSDTKPIVSCYGHARLDQHLPLPVFSPANALDQAFLL